MSDEAPLHHPVDSALAVAEALTDTTPPSLTKVFGGKLVFGSDGCAPSAGATITKDVPPGELTVTEKKQVTRPGWQRPRKK